MNLNLRIRLINTGARLCAKHQPQQAAKIVGIGHCCGWSFRHSRAPFPIYKMACRLAILLAVAVSLQRIGFAEDVTTRVLTLQQAQDIAVTNHPRITQSELLALASKQVVRETQSAYYPKIHADATAVDATANNTRVTAGGLNNPLILTREADGLIATQLITDFGRTANLTATSRLDARVQEQNVLATRAQILLAVNSAYFDALQAQSILGVALQTVTNRQLIFDQVNELAKDKLRSGLDVSFAKVDLDSSKLLLANANNDLRAAFATLANVLGERTEVNYQLREEPTPAGPVPDNAQLIQIALQNRPDLLQQRFGRDAAMKFARAEKDLNYPTVSAVGVAGISPIHDSALRNNYVAAGLNIDLPLFEGMLFSAREKAAQFRAQAAEQSLRDAENNVVRDVRIARLNLDYAAEKLALTAELLASANESFELAQARLKVGSISIVELSQAQLNQTQAEIAQARAKYEYQARNVILNYQLGILH